MPNLWGIDLGGTKIEGVVLNALQPSEVISRLRVPTQSERGYEHILDQIARLVNELKTETGQSPGRIGFGTPGTLDPITQTLKNSNTVCLNGKPFKQDIEQKLGVPVAIANDANCFALAETKMGVVARQMPAAEVVFGVIMGTGVGGGLVVNGKVINGRQGIGGEWGHNYLDASGGSCYCGKTGCVETVLSGPALQRYYQFISGNVLKLPEIYQRCQMDANVDVHATATIERLLTLFGVGLSAVINIVDPDAIVLGGGVGNIDSLYTRGVAEIRKNVFNNRLDTVFLKPMLGDSAGVFGAAMLVSDS